MANVFTWLGDRVLQAVGYDIDARLELGGIMWRQRSQALAPVRTGLLRARETFRVENHTLTLILGAPYDIFQEFGTRHLDPRPHVRPALNEISIPWGGSVVMDFNRLGGLVWQGMYAHQAGFVEPSAIQPRQLTERQREHVHHTLIPTSQHYYGGRFFRRRNVRRARFRVRRFNG